MIFGVWYFSRVPWLRDFLATRFIATRSVSGTLRADRTHQDMNFPSVARGSNSASFRYKINILDVWRDIITLTPKVVTSSMTSSQDAFYLKIYLLLGFLTNGKTDHANNWRESQAKKVRFEIFYSCWSFINICRESFQSRLEITSGSIFGKVEPYFFEQR